MTHKRPRSSIVNVIGWCTSGSPANTVALNPGGSVIVFAVCSGVMPVPAATGNPSWATARGASTAARRDDANQMGRRGVKSMAIKLGGRESSGDIEDGVGKEKT